LGVLGDGRRLLVLGDGAAWIRTWFEGLEIPSKAMALCWWHLRKRCYERRFSRLRNLPIRHSILSGQPFDYPGF